MDAKQLVAATALATSILTFGSGIAVAAPLDPPPSDPSAASPTPPTQGDEVLAVRPRRPGQRPRRRRGAGVPAAVPTGNAALIARR